MWVCRLCLIACSRILTLIIRCWSYPPVHSAGAGFDSRFSLVSYCHATTMPWCRRWFGFPVLPCELLPCYCHATAMPWSWRWFGFPVHPCELLPCYCHAVVLALVWCPGSTSSSLAHHHHHHHPAPSSSKGAQDAQDPLLPAPYHMCPTTCVCPDLATPSCPATPPCATRMRTCTSSRPTF